MQQYSNDNPFLTVFMVTYNHEQYIRQSLQSVVDQKTNFPFQVVIGEDCSTDGTRAILKEFEQRYPHIIKPVYHEKNVGAYRNAYEFCYPLLKGKYIACLEADDYWTDNNKLQMQVDMLEADPSASLCFTNTQFLNQSTGVYEDHWAVKFIKGSRIKLQDLLVTNVISTCSVVFRHIYPQLPSNFLDFPTTDLPLFLFLLLKGDGLYLDKVTAVYRLHDKGTFSQTAMQTQILIALKNFETLLTFKEFTPYTPLIKRLISDKAYQAMCFEIKKEDPDRDLIKQLARKSVTSAHMSNLYLPFKALVRRNLFLMTNKSFGRTVQEA
jgi:glycosyltransferase involved in cell wall biosynthesis